MNRFLVALIFLITSGCGYTTRGFVYESDKIIIYPVENKIDIASGGRRVSGYVNFPILIENKLTNELVNKFNVDGHLKVVSQDLGALRLACTVNSYSKEALRYTDSDDIREQRLRLHVHIQLVHSKGKLLKDKLVVGESTFFLSGPNQRSEVSAQGDLIDDTARRISEAVLEEW